MHTKEFFPGSIQAGDCSLTAKRQESPKYFLHSRGHRQVRVEKREMEMETEMEIEGEDAAIPMEQINKHYSDNKL